MKVRSQERTVNDSACKDWLAYIELGGGSGSWARGKDRADTIRRLLRIFKSDWNGLIDFGGLEVGVIVADVTGLDQVYFDSCSVWTQPPAEEREPGKRPERTYLDKEKLEVVKHIYPGRPKKK